MKHTAIITILLMLFTACKKTSDSPYQSQGILLGANMNYTCAYCGGLEISLKNDTPQLRMIASTLDELGIDPATKFPINVSLNWKPDTLPWPSNYIIVTKIKVDK